MHSRLVKRNCKICNREITVFPYTRNPICNDYFDEEN